MFEKMKKSLSAFAAFCGLMVTNASYAALDAADMTALSTEVDADITTVKDAVLPLIFTIIAIVVGIKLLKKLSNKI